MCEMSRVQEFIDQGARPRFDGDDSLQLRIGRRFVRLSAPGGALNAAGNEYEQRTGETLPASGFQNQKAIRKGNTETIRLRTGRRAMTRRWNATSNRWDFTNLGNILPATASQLGRAGSSHHQGSAERPLDLRNQGCGPHSEDGDHRAQSPTGRRHAHPEQAS